MKTPSWPNTPYDPRILPVSSLLACFRLSASRARVSTTILRVISSPVPSLPDPLLKWDAQSRKDREAARVHRMSRNRLLRRDVPLRIPARDLPGTERSSFPRSDSMVTVDSTPPLSFFLPHQRKGLLLLSRLHCADVPWGLPSGQSHA